MNKLLKKDITNIRDNIQKGGLVSTQIDTVLNGVEAILILTEDKCGVYLVTDSDEYKGEQDDIINNSIISKITNLKKIIGYSTDNITYPPIVNYEHRGLWLDESLRGNKGIADSMFDIHNTIGGEKDKEITKNISIIKFYLKHGYSIKSIHIPYDIAESRYRLNKEKRSRFINHELDDRQKMIILNYIFESNLEQTLFFIELEKGKNIDKKILLNDDDTNIVKGMKILSDNIILKEAKLYSLLPLDIINIIEDGLALNKTKLSIIDKSTDLFNNKKYREIMNNNNDNFYDYSFYKNHK